MCKLLDCFDDDRIAAQVQSAYPAYNSYSTALRDKNIRDAKYINNASAEYAELVTHQAVGVLAVLFAQYRLQDSNQQVLKKLLKEEDAIPDLALPLTMEQTAQFLAKLQKNNNNLYQEFNGGIVSGDCTNGFGSFIYDLINLYSTEQDDEDRTKLFIIGSELYKKPLGADNLPKGQKDHRKGYILAYSMYAETLSFFHEYHCGNTDDRTS